MDMFVVYRGWGRNVVNIVAAFFLNRTNKKAEMPTDRYSMFEKL